MAITKEIIIKADADDAISETEKLTNAIDKLSGEVSKMGKETEKSFDKAQKGSSKLSKGFKGIGTALKALGIGIVVALFAKLAEILGKNQKVMDIFTNVMTTLEIAFNDLFSFVTDNFMPAFENIKKFFAELTFDKIKNAIQENIIERFNSVLDVLGFVGTAFKELFAGNFSGALDAIGNAGKEMADVWTGVDGTFDKVSETLKSTVDSVVNYAKESYNAADAITEVAKQALIAEAINQGLIEKYDRQAEQQRQIRDDESRSIEDRIAANIKLGEILEEQEKTMLENAELSITAAANELALNDNIENQIALIEAKNERMAIQAQVEGFRSEQLINTNSLLKEQIELEKNAVDDSIVNEEKKKEIADKAIEDKKKIAAEELLIQEEKIRAEQITQDALLASKMQEVDNVANISNLLASLGKESKALQVAAIIANAGASIAKTVVSTQAANAIITAEGLALAIPTAGSSVVAATGLVAANNVSAGISIGAQVLAAGQGISKLGGGGSIKGSSSSAGGGGGGGAAPAPSFNLVEGTGTNQISDSLSRQDNPIKAFVVSSDVSNAQSLDRNIVENSSL